MKHCGTKKIETERLILRKFVMDDVAAVYNNWANDPEVTKYLTWQTHSNVDISSSVLADWTSHYNEPDFYQWAITLKKNGNEPIGSISVVRKDDRIKMVTIGYCIGKKWWHKGIMTEALQTLIKFFFEEVGANRIEAWHDPKNINSGKVMSKCGMQYEGVHRDADWNNQGICDVAMYAILANSYSPEN